MTRAAYQYSFASLFSLQNAPNPSYSAYNEIRFYNEKRTIARWVMLGEKSLIKMDSSSCYTKKASNK